LLVNNNIHSYKMNFVEWRIKLWEQLEKKVELLPVEEIFITLLDGKQIQTNNRMTPIDIAKQLGLKKVIACELDGIVTDMWKHFEKNCSIKFLTFEDENGRKVFWHSTAHILGLALEEKFQANLSVGPALEGGGFYYEGRLPNGMTISDKDLVDLEELMKACVNQAYPFQRLIVTKADALEMMKHNPYKIAIINSKVPDGENCTLYKCGPFIDLCRGPHLPNTGYVQAIKLKNVSSSYFMGKPANDSLQRVYGVSFPDNKKLKEYLHFIKEAEKRNHKKIGVEQELFMFSDTSPGSCFWMPNGVVIYNRLTELIRKQYWDRGFQEVRTPAIARSALWKVSGHWDKYKDDMFVFENDEEEWAIAPMNCPKHCEMFGMRPRSYKELPIRWADFGVLHRNEASGALSGLTRVRAFCQDDAHIYAKPEDIQNEIFNALKFLDHIYGIFGFEFKLDLSTRPENYIGSPEIWELAEVQLADALNSWGKPWSVCKGDGAFYGPKIDIHIKDALNREFQCATIQLDFNLPDRFNLTYVDADQSIKRPVMIHRAIYGSLERFIGILTEHYGGRWPFWLSPRQAIVVPISKDFIEYGQHVRSELRKFNYCVDIDLTDRTVTKKVREAQISQYNYILIVGQVEEKAGTINVRYRDTVEKKEINIQELLKEFAELTVL
jgi:threonyl-tRNA synthetase